MVFTPQSAPSLYTLRAQIRNGTLPGVKHGRQYYVDLDEFDRLHDLGDKLRAERAALLEKLPRLKELL